MLKQHFLTDNECGLLDTVITLQLAAELEKHGWKDKIRPVEVGCKSFIAKSLSEEALKGQSLKQAVKNVAISVARFSEWVWRKRKVCDCSKDA